MRTFLHFIVFSLFLFIAGMGGIAVADEAASRSSPREMEQACDGGSSDACYDLAMRYEDGDGVAKNQTTATTLYQRACDGGDAYSCATMVVRLAEGTGIKASLPRAVQYAQRSCDGGAITGCLFLGRAYEAGEGGLPKDLGKAADAYQFVCEKRSNTKLMQSASVRKIIEEACANLADLGPDYAPAAPAKVVPQSSVQPPAPSLLDQAASWNRSAINYAAGNGVAKNPALAASLYQKACAANLAEGCTNAGVSYQNGSGVAASNAQAAAYYTKGCDGNDRLGCFYLGWLYDAGLGVAKDQARAAGIYDKACQAGVYAACRNLGYLYDQGLGVARNLTSAASYYALACDAQDVAACYHLGTQYYNGDGLTKNGKLAARFLAVSCDQNDVKSCALLGLIYDDGEGVSQNAKFANPYLKMACDKNIDVDTYCFKYAYNVSNGNGINQNRAEGSLIYKRLCEHSDFTSCSNLGWNYQQGGAGVSQSYATANFYFKKSCDGGNGTGCINLGWNYDNANGFAKSIAMAKIYYRKACDLKEDLGCSNLAILERPPEPVRTYASSSSSGGGYNASREVELDIMRQQNDAYERQMNTPPPYSPPMTPIGGAGGMYGCASPPCW